MTLLRHLPAVLRLLAWNRVAASQSDDEESRALCDIARTAGVTPTFVEFGFGVYELNAAGLIRAGWTGQLLDGDGDTCRSMDRIMRRHRRDVQVRQHWFTVDNVDPVLEFTRTVGQLGVLSVDIDGNDFWILSELLRHGQPDLLILEYNASFGLRPVTVPYDPQFDRHRYSATGWYHGASITAFHRLLHKDYALVRNVRGLNLIFLRRDLSDGFPDLSPDDAYAEQQSRNARFGNDAAAQFHAIQDLPLIEIGDDGRAVPVG